MGLCSPELQSHPASSLLVTYFPAGNPWCWTGHVSLLLDGQRRKGPCKHNLGSSLPGVDDAGGEISQGHDFCLLLTMGHNWLISSSEEDPLLKSIGEHKNQNCFPFFINHAGTQALERNLWALALGPYSLHLNKRSRSSAVNVVSK